MTFQSRSSAKMITKFGRWEGEAVDRRALLYEPGTNGPRLVAARVQTSPEFRVLSREPLFEMDQFETAAPHANYDVHSDGDGFAMVRRAAASQIIVVKNFHLEVDRANRQSP